MSTLSNLRRRLQKYSKTKKDLEEIGVSTTVIENPPPTPAIEEEHVPRTEQVVANKNYWKFVYGPVLSCLALFIAILIYGSVLNLLLSGFKILVPGCPSVNGRVCNEQGTCVNGRCDCNSLFSGSDCAANQVPGYDIANNRFCNGNGFVLAYNESYVPVECREVINGGARQGGWMTETCANYVDSIRSKILQVNGDVSLVPLGYTIPSCTCIPGVGGWECNLRNVCPRDENLRVCGGHGNTSVGLIANYTNAGEGCQCDSLVAFYEERFASMWTPEFYDYLNNRYNYDMNRLYCGIVKQVVNVTTGEPIQNYVIAYTIPSNYFCACDDDWRGSVCTEGKCPVSLQTGKTCSGNGHPLYGQGYKVGAPVKQIKGIRCTIECMLDHEACGDKCFPKNNTIDGISPFIYNAGFCNNPTTCPRSAPIRCADGSCASIPLSFSKNCNLGYQFGSIDYGRLDVSIENYRCPNITNVELYDICFQNTTWDNNVLGFVETVAGGIVVNFTDPSYRFRINFTSPLIYFQISTNLTGLYVENFNGDIKFFNNFTINGLFDYDLSLRWGSRIDFLMTSTTQDNKYYTFTPAPFNYSGLTNGDFTLFRVTNVLQRKVFILDVVTTILNYEPIVNFVDVDNGLLVLYNTSGVGGTLTELYWLSPSTGTIVSNEMCLSEPSQYSWYVDIDVQAVRSLDERFYICVDLDANLPIVQLTPCIYDLSELLVLLPEVFYRWDTSIYALSQSTEVLYVDYVDFYQLPVENDLPYSVDIYYLPSTNNQGDNTQTNLYALLSGFVFLTKDVGIGFPCSCDIPTTLTNQSTLNNLWYLDTNTRSLKDVKIGDYVVYPSFITGDRVLRRGTVSSFDDESEVLEVVSDGVVEISYYADTRSLNAYEYISGTPDGEFLLNPFKCPSGKYTDAQLNLDISDVSCNCTYINPGSDANFGDTSYNCSCVNDFTTLSRFNCECLVSDCICGFPANREFASLLVETMQNVLNGGCGCLVYSGYQAGMKESTSNLNVSEYFQMAYNVNSDSYRFDFYPENVIEYVLVEFDMCDGTEAFELLGGSQYFSSSEYQTVRYETSNNGSSVGNWVYNCQYYLNLVYNPSLVFTNLTVITNSSFPMVNVTLAFMKYGFSLMELQETKGIDVQVRASSNQQDAYKVIWLGSGGWRSSGSLHENPITLEFSYTFNSYMTNYLIIFKTAGRKSGNFIIPLRVYIQGSNDMDFWYSIDSFQIYIDPLWGGDPYSDSRYQVHRYVPILNQTYAHYRLMSTSFILDVLHVDLFTNVTCECNWSDVNLTNPLRDPYFGIGIQLSGLEGLENITAQTDEYYRLLDNFNTFDGCLCTDNCTLMDESATFNGICNDVIYQASLLGITEDSSEQLVIIYTPNNFSQTTADYVYQGYYVTPFIDSGYMTVQFYTNIDDVMDLDAQETYFLTYGGVLPLVNETTGLYIYYMNSSYFIVGMGDDANIWQWVYGTLNVTYTQYYTVYGNLINTGAACAAGTDCGDCGFSTRKNVLSPGQTCNPFNPFNAFNGLFNQSVNLYYRSLVVNNLNTIVTPWYGEIQRLTFDLERPSLYLESCGGEVCPRDTPWKCDNGRCVRRKSDCFDTYTCPGNGCIKLTNSSDFGAYRCACRPGSAGDDCSYTECRPATTDVPAEEGRVPPSEECMCGGPPPLRIKPPVLNKKAFYTTEELIVINQRSTGSCAPRSKKDTGWVCILPTFAPWGQVVLRRTRVPISPLLPNTFQDIDTTCPPCRKGYYGECLMRQNDVLFENVFTGEAVFKTYTNPFTGGPERFVWANPFSYDELPYRCPNSDCVANRDECALSEVQFPLANNRGTCLADGSIKCAASYQTFLINNELSAKIRYPYEWDARQNTTNPVAWTINDNWRLYRLNQCAARECSYGKCKVPKGCRSGTYELGFEDKEILCPNNNLCAKNIYACYGNVNLTSPGDCSFNGVKRIKDVTGEEYCECGTPVSPLLDIGEVTSIVQLKPNGYGGPNCANYFANQNTPLYWSPWDYKNNVPYRDKVTGQILPGIWIKGNIPMGARPEDKLIWDKCCQGYDSYKLCPFVPCRTPPTISCLTQQACLAFDPNGPLLYACNDHGVARADGTCLCDYNRDEGYVYVSDNSVTDGGCYKLESCQRSRLTDVVCDTPSQCEDPSVWQYPFAPIPYIDQQWLMASTIKGPYNNATLLELLNINQDSFEEQIQEALGKKAQEVQRAIASYSGCVCYFPGDTDTYRQGMIVNNKQYVYKQAFTSPYLLPVTTNSFYDQIFQGYVYPVGPDMLDFPLTLGTTIEITFPQNFVVISAVRVMASPGGTITFYDSNGIQICPTVVLQQYTVDFTYPIFNWNGGASTTGSTLGRALQCGPVYQCVPGKSFFDYENLCGVKTTTDQCIAYRESSCDNAGYIYWPEGSLDVYPGCDRIADPDGCVCCRRITPLQSITNGKLYMRVTSVPSAGPVYLAKTRFYGYSNQTLDSPTEFDEYVSSGLGYVTTWQDQRFYRARLGADRSYYTFPPTSSQSKGTFENARDVCSLRGGYMAVGVPSLNSIENSNTAESSVTLLQSECGNIQNGNGLCWVNARSLMSERNIPRVKLYSPTCDQWGCFYSNLFYTNSSVFNYNTSYLAYIGNTQYTQYPVTSYITNDIQSAGGVALNLDFYAATYCISPGNCKMLPQAGQNTVLTITYRNGDRFVFLFNHNLNLAQRFSVWTSPRNPTIAYGTFMSTSQYFPIRGPNGDVGATNENSQIASITVTGNSPMRFQTAPDISQCVFQPKGGYANTMFKYPASSNKDDTNSLLSKLFYENGLKDGDPGVLNNLDFGTGALVNYLASICSMNNILMNLAFPTGDRIFNFCTSTRACTVFVCGPNDWSNAKGNFGNSLCCLRQFGGYSQVISDVFCNRAIDSFQSFQNEYCATYFSHNAYQKLRNVAGFLQQPSSNTIDIEPGCTYNFLTNQRICNNGQDVSTINNGDLTPLSIMLQRGRCVIPILSTRDQNKAYPVLSSYMSSFVNSRPVDEGAIGINKVFGYQQHPYMPVFLTGGVLSYTLTQRPPTDPYFYSLMQYRSTQGGVFPPSSETPIYLIQPRWVGMTEGHGWLKASNVKNCTACYDKEGNLCYWDQMYYSQVTWQNQFNCPVPDVFVVNTQDDGPQAIRRSLNSFAIQSSFLSSAFFIHQTLYIQNYLVNPFPKINWYLPTCLAVSKSGSILQFCDTEINNIICQYDWTKYACVAGTMCDVGGCSTTAGAVPVPGLTCGLDNPLANATLYPYDHLILKNYQLGTLGEFARSFNIAPEVYDFQNVSVIFGIPGAWEKWAGCYCDRQGFTAFGVESSLNWVCFCVPTIWPVDCGKQLDPRTNIMKRYCAVREEYCNIYLNDTEVSGPPMRVADIPPLLRPVDSDLSVIDPTCGANLQLSSYVIIDRFGGPQTDLNLYSKFININDQFIQLQITAQTAQWYNGGKTSIDFKFDWDIPSSVTFYYNLELCTDCSTALLEVMIYPLNLEYNEPDNIISYNISMVKDVLTLVSVEFIVTLADTGFYTIEGETFPLRVYKGIGFKVHNVDAGSLVTLYNPVVTTNITRFECETREIPPWYEPPLRIESRSPERFCPVTQDEVDYYPNAQLGRCYCGTDRAGAGCDCIATTSKYGNEVCGGFGDSNKLVIGADNVYYSTGVGEEAGCYIYTLTSGRKFSDCKAVDLGRYIFTLFVQNAVFDYPSVYVDFSPAKDVPIFRYFEDATERETYVQCVVSCASIGMYMPYYETIDTLNQLLVDTRGFLPVFMGVDTLESTPTSWPWDKSNAGYFLRDPDLEYMSEQGTCNADVCAVVNFNNYAYLSTITPVSASATALHDGNTLSRVVQSGTYQVVWSEASDLVVTIVLFGDLTGADTVTCDAGICDAFTSNGVIKTSSCRCPGRFMSLLIADNNKISEVQVFNSVDTIRSSSYIYI